MTVAQVAADAAVDRTFDYIVPPALAPRVVPGALVRVSFSHRIIEGVVVSLSDESEFAAKLKPVDSVGDEPVLSPPLVELAKWMSAYYVAPIGLCIKTMVPPKVRGGVDRDSFRRMLAVKRSVAPTGVTPTPRQREILDRLGDGEEFLTGFCEAWGFSPQTLRRMQKDGLVEIFEKVARRDPLSGRRVLPSKPLALTPEQAAALKTIVGAGGKPVLLNGVTASGKTEVYLQAIAAVLARGKSAIVLVPEIALTPQTINRFVARFGEIVAVLHSRLSNGERHDEWQRLRSGAARVVVGPRSALFAPVRDLGLIVVDEEHEPSYKQDETPRYQARDVAVMRAHIEKCDVTLGSATPSLESWNNAKNGKYALAVMRSRATEMQLPHTSVVDMRGEAAKNDGRMPVFSETLIQAMRNRLDNGEQTMLFLNRRGWATAVTCPSCGHSEVCDNCSVGMTWHRDDDVLRCHICGAYRSVPRTCPECGCEDYRRVGSGTQRVEDIARRIFPGAKIARMDLDVTTRKRSHEDILGEFRDGKTDILIGTQMIAKGLDFPNVTLAGVMHADSALHIPDFRAAERTFQLIAQMAGRAGRGAKAGDVIVQTTDPTHPAIVCAARGDYETFAEGEMEERRMLRYPPFSHYALLTVRSEDRTEAENHAALLASAIGTGDGYVLGAPCPAPIEKANGKWRYQLTLRGERASVVIGRIRAALAACRANDRIHVAVDIDALG